MNKVVKNVNEPVVAKPAVVQPVADEQVIVQPVGEKEATIANARVVNVEHVVRIEKTNGPWLNEDRMVAPAVDPKLKRCECGKLLGEDKEYDVCPACGNVRK